MFLTVFFFSSRVSHYICDYAEASKSSVLLLLDPP